ncbi:MAG TPA: hypothetical protein PKH39_18865 [Woeseiaceae bacterium]|nr:hypothetical protein [Woeseiaceae bacterium]
MDSRRCDCWPFHSRCGYAATQEDVDEVVTWSVGEFCNDAQMVDPEEDRKGASLRYQFATRLPDGVFGGIAIYYEWREPDAGGPIIKTRVWVLSPDPDGIEMRYYTLHERAASALAGVHSGEDAKAAAANYSLDDLQGIPGNRLEPGIDPFVLTTSVGVLYLLIQLYTKSGSLAAAHYNRGNSDELFSKNSRCPGVAGIG